MMTQPLHVARRPPFLEIGGPAHDLLKGIDDELTALRTSVSEARRGQAAHQQPHMQLVTTGAALGSPVTPTHAATLGNTTVTLGASPHKTLVVAQPDPVTWPTGVYKDWGDNAVKLGLWKTPEGILFGNQLCQSKSAEPTSFKEDSCCAGCAPNDTARNRSKWCCKLTCKHHDLPDGKSKDDYTYTRLPKDYDRSKLVVIVSPYQPYLSIKDAVAPQPPEGHAARSFWQSKATTETGGRGVGKSKGGKEQGRGSRGGKKRERTSFEGSSNSPSEEARKVHSPPPPHPSAPNHSGKGPGGTCAKTVG